MVNIVNILNGMGHEIDTPESVLLRLQRAGDDEELICEALIVVGDYQFQAETLTLMCSLHGFSALPEYARNQVFAQIACLGDVYPA